MTQGIGEYYEKYWTRDSDVSDHDTTTPERKYRLLSTLDKYCEFGDSILDLGCGWGQFTAWIKEAGFEAIGVDISKKAAEMSTCQKEKLTEKSLPFSVFSVVRGVFSRF